MSKYGVFSGSYIPVFGLNTGKYGPEKTLYLDTFHAVDAENSVITNTLYAKNIITTKKMCKTSLMWLTVEIIFRMLFSVL